MLLVFRRLFHETNDGLVDSTMSSENEDNSCPCKSINDFTFRILLKY